MESRASPSLPTLQSPMKPLTLILPLALTLGAAGSTIPVPAESSAPLKANQEAQDFPAARAALNKNLATSLEEFAGRCTKARAYLQRDLCYEMLLMADPEHKTARKTLKYKKDRKTGEWSRNKYKAPKDRDGKLVAALTEEREGFLEAHAVAVLQLLDAHQAELSSEEIAVETQALLAALPNSERVRTYLGQVQLEKNGETHWVQASTVRALEQRKAQYAAWKKALKQVDEVEDAEILAKEEALGVTFKACSEGSTYRVLSSVIKSETTFLARKLEALTLWMHPLLGTNEPDGMVHVYLISQEEGAGFISEFPDLTDAIREDLKGSNGAWLGRADRVGVWNSHGKSRMDQTIRLVISYALLDTYGRIDGGWVKNGLPAWMDQGLGIYLCWKMNETKLSVQLRDSGYASSNDDPTTKLQGGEDDWIVHARAAMTRKRKPTNLALALGRNVGTLTTRELYVTYGFSAWLLEGHGPEIVHEILSRAGQRENPVTLLEEVLKRPFPQIEDAFRQWLREIKHS